MIALGVACRKNADIPAAAARTLCDKRNRPKRPDQAARRVPSVLRADENGEAGSERMTCENQALRSVSRSAEKKPDGYSQGLQAARAGGASAQLFRAGAFQPCSGRDRSDWEHGRGRQWGPDDNHAWVATHRVEENASLLIHDVVICCATTRHARTPPVSMITGAGTPPATVKSTTISSPRDCRCLVTRRCPPSMDCQAGTRPRATTDNCRLRRQRTDARRPLRAQAGHATLVEDAFPRRGVQRHPRRGALARSGEPCQRNGTRAVLAVPRASTA